MSHFTMRSAEVAGYDNLEPGQKRDIDVAVLRCLIALRDAQAFYQISNLAEIIAARVLEMGVLCDG